MLAKIREWPIEQAYFIHFVFVQAEVHICAHADISSPPAFAQLLTYYQSINRITILLHRTKGPQKASERTNFFLHPQHDGHKTHNIRDQQCISITPSQHLKRHCRIAVIISKTNTFVIVDLLHKLPS